MRKETLYHSLVEEARQRGGMLEASYTGILGLVIATLRHGKKMTQGQLAKASGVSQATISRVEMGEADITALQMDAISNALGHTPGFIFDATDEIRKILKEENIGVTKKPSSNMKSGAAGAAMVAVTGAMLATGPLGLIIGSIVGVVLASRNEKK